MFLAEKRNKNKTVLDWAELEAAVTEQRRLTKVTPESELALSTALQRHGQQAYVAQLHERLIAIGRPTGIELAWLHTSPGAALSESKLEGGRAYVYPAAGGRTQYKVCESARGHFLNRWLPFNASDRQTKSNFRSWRWAWGAGGMYRDGMGPALLECGIDALQQTPANVLARIAAAGQHVSDEWRAAAVRLVEAFDGWRDTFEDTRILFQEYGIDKQERRPDTVDLRPGGDRRDGVDTTLAVAYCLRLRLRRPMEEQSGRFVPVDDLSICVMPQPLDLGFGPKAMYALLRQSTHSQGDSSWGGQAPARLITTSVTEVLHVAREFSAASVYIPAL